jgi:hypothetical protein
MCDSRFLEYPLSAIGDMPILVFVSRDSLAATPSAIRMTMRVGAIDYIKNIVRAMDDKNDLRKK